MNGSFLTPVAAVSCSWRMRVPAAVQAPALVQLSRYEAGVVDESEYRRNEGVERPRTTVRCQKRHARQLVVSIKYILLAGFRISGQYDSLLLAMALGLEETRVSSAELFPSHEAFDMLAVLTADRKCGLLAAGQESEGLVHSDRQWPRRRALRDRWLGRVHWPKCVVPGCSPSRRWPWPLAVRTCRPAQVEAARAGTNGRRLISAC